MKIQLINTEVKELIKIMASLSESSENIAKVYHHLNGDVRDMEESKEFLQAQTSINNAIKEVGGILGTSLAETFFCTELNKIDINLK